MTTEDDPGGPFEAIAREVLADPVPGQLVDRCGELLTWRTVDGELAELVAESGGLAAAGVRDEEPGISLTFASDGYLVEVDVVAGTLVGHVSPPIPAVVVVDSPSGGVEAPLDEVGGFRLPAPAAGPFRVVLRHRSGGVVVRTPWVTI